MTFTVNRLGPQFAEGAFAEHERVQPFEVLSLNLASRVRKFVEWNSVLVGGCR